MAPGAEFNVLISSAGRRVALLRAFQKSLGRLGLPGQVMAADCSPYSSAFQSAGRAFLVPRLDSPDFIPAMLKICRDNGVRLVVPTIDTELRLYAENADRFREQGTMVSVSKPATVKISMDKVFTHDWFVENKIPTVATFAAEAGKPVPAGLDYPLIVKPRGGSSSIGVYRVNSAAELESLLQSSSGTIVQEMARGVEFTINVFVNGAGKCVCQAPHHRIEVRHGEVSKGVTRKDAELMGWAKKIAEALPGAFGALCFQCFRSERGELKFIEINARFGGGFPLAYEAGADFPGWLIAEAAEGRRAADFNDWTDGLVMLRYDDAAFVVEKDLVR